jgi:hypothetical protein
LPKIEHHNEKRHCRNQVHNRSHQSVTALPKNPYSMPNGSTTTLAHISWNCTESRVLSNIILHQPTSTLQYHFPQKSQPWQSHHVLFHVSLKTRQSFTKLATGPVKKNQRSTQDLIFLTVTGKNKKKHL